MYRYLILFLIIIFSLNLVYAELSRFFPKKFDLDILSSIDFYLLLALIFGWIIMFIHRRVRPEKYIAPKELKDRPQDDSYIGFIIHLCKEFIQNDKDLLIDQKDIKPIMDRKMPTEAEKKFGYKIALSFIFLIIIGCLFTYFMIKYNYQKTYKFIDFVEHTEFFKIVNKADQSHY